MKQRCSKPLTAKVASDSNVPRALRKTISSHDHDHSGNRKDRVVEIVVDEPTDRGAEMIPTGEVDALNVALLADRESLDNRLCLLIRTVVGKSDTTGSGQLCAFEGEHTVRNPLADGIVRVSLRTGAGKSVPGVEHRIGEPHG